MPDRVEAAYYLLFNFENSFSGMFLETFPTAIRPGGNVFMPNLYLKVLLIFREAETQFAPQILHYETHHSCWMWLLVKLQIGHCRLTFLLWWRPTILFFFWIFTHRKAYLLTVSPFTGYPWKVFHGLFCQGVIWMPRQSYYQRNTFLSSNVMFVISVLY